MTLSPHGLKPASREASGPRVYTLWSHGPASDVARTHHTPACPDPTGLSGLWAASGSTSLSPSQPCCACGHRMTSTASSPLPSGARSEWTGLVPAPLSLLGPTVYVLTSARAVSIATVGVHHCPQPQGDGTLGNCGCFFPQPRSLSSPVAEPNPCPSAEETSCPHPLPALHGREGLDTTRWGATSSSH